jgi:hypothetical protein
MGHKNPVTKLLGIARHAIMRLDDKTMVCIDTNFFYLTAGVLLRKLNTSTLSPT